MTSEYNIIGDVAGNFLTLQQLLKKMPSSATPLSLGDMCDRGPRSKEVLSFFMENGKALLGNHEHMMLDKCTRGGSYGSFVWFSNGGTPTVRSFFPTDSETQLRNRVSDIPKDVLDWISSLPLHLELEENINGLKGFISHAPKHPHLDLDSCKKIDSQQLQDATLIWYRGATQRIEGYYQIFGHNSHWGLEYQSDDKGEYGICIDTSASSVLTGLHWPSMVLYQQEYID
jgi:hypothetical protein